MAVQELGIGAVARSVGTTVRTLRYYEQVGLIRSTSRSGGGHRRYSTAEVRRLRRVLALRDLGVPLERIKPLIDGDDAPALLHVLVEQREQVAAQLRLLTDVQRRLDDLAGKLRDLADPGSTDLPATSDVLDLLEVLSMALALTRIYTRTGDDGTTGLGSADRVLKIDDRLEALGAVDELNAALGVVLATQSGQARAGWLRRIQNELFDVGADLAVPATEADHHDGNLAGAVGSPPLRVTPAYTGWLERACDEANQQLPPLRSFVLPGGTPAAAQLHVARAVCRRAERRAAAGDEDSGVHGYPQAAELRPTQDVLQGYAGHPPVHHGGQVGRRPSRRDEQPRLVFGEDAAGGPKPGDEDGTRTR